jgi:hypothetical protein
MTVGIPVSISLASRTLRSFDRSLLPRRSALQAAVLFMLLSPTMGTFCSSTDTIWSELAVNAAITGDRDA